MTCTSASPQQVAVAILDVVFVISRFSRSGSLHCNPLPNPQPGGPGTVPCQASNLRPIVKSMRHASFTTTVLCQPGVIINYDFGDTLKNGPT